MATLSKTREIRCWTDSFTGDDVPLRLADFSFWTVVRILSDGKPHTHEELLARLARAHALTPDQCKLTMANGHNIFVSRVGNALGRLVTKKAVVKLAGEDGETLYQMAEHGQKVVKAKGKSVKISDF